MPGHGHCRWQRSMCSILPRRPQRRDCFWEAYHARKTLDRPRFCGRVLHIYLTTGSHEYEYLDEDFYSKYLGGVGLGAKILWDRLQPGVDPMGPENILGFAAACGGHQFSVHRRFMLVGKSPNTGGWGDSNCGGNFGPALKRCGLDAVFFHGPLTGPYMSIWTKRPWKSRRLKPIGGWTPLKPKNGFGGCMASVPRPPASDRPEKNSALWPACPRTADGTPGAAVWVRSWDPKSSRPWWWPGAKKWQWPSLRS